MSLNRVIVAVVTYYKLLQQEKERKKLVDELVDAMRPFYKSYVECRVKGFTEQQIHNVFFEEIWPEYVTANSEEPDFEKANFESDKKHGRNVTCISSVL